MIIVGNYFSIFAYQKVIEIHLGICKLLSPRIHTNDCLFSECVICNKSSKLKIHPWRKCELQFQKKKVSFEKKVIYLDNWVVYLLPVPYTIYWFIYLSIHLFKLLLIFLTQRRRKFSKDVYPMDIHEQRTVQKFLSSSRKLNGHLKFRLSY